MTGEQKDSILVELLSNGSGSMDYAKILLDFGGTVPVLPPSKPSWCVCGICRPMPSEEEIKCCGKITCVTSFVTFRNVCTDREVLIMAIWARCDIRADEIDYSMNSFRKAAYRQYIVWRYKKVGRGNRKTNLSQRMAVLKFSYIIVVYRSRCIPLSNHVPFVWILTPSFEG